MDSAAEEPHAGGGRRAAEHRRASSARRWPRHRRHRSRVPAEASNLPLNAAVAHTVVTMVDGGRIPDSGEIQADNTPTFDIADSFRWRSRAASPRDRQDRKGVRGSDEGKPGNRRAGEAHRHQDPRQEGSAAKAPTDRRREAGHQDGRAAAAKAAPRHRQGRSRPRPPRRHAPRPSRPPSRAAKAQAEAARRGPAPHARPREEGHRSTPDAEPARPSTTTTSRSTISRPSPATTSRMPTKSI